MATAGGRSLRMIWTWLLHLYIRFCLDLAIFCIKDGFVVWRESVGLYFTRVILSDADCFSTYRLKHTNQFC
jgi:hypothetical protein